MSLHQPAKRVSLSGCHLAKNRAVVGQHRRNQPLSPLPAVPPAQELEASWDATELTRNKVPRMELARRVDGLDKPH